MKSISWDNITVEQYQAMCAINLEEIDEVDKIIRIISVLYDITENGINDLPVTTFNKLTVDIAALFQKDAAGQPTIPGKAKNYIKANRKRYHLSYDIGKSRLGQYIEAQHFLKGGIIENLHLIAASIAAPVKFYFIKGKNDSDKHEQVSNDFLQAKFIDVYHSVVFFCNVFKGFNKNYSGLFGEQDDDDEDEPPPNAFSSRFGWVYSATQIAEHERIKLNEAYDLTVVNAFNDLAYLKAYKKHEEEMNRKARREVEV